MYQALYTTGQAVKTGDPAVGGEIVPGALFCSASDTAGQSKLTYTVGGKTYTMGGNTTAAYKGVMSMQAETVYWFVKHFDDWGLVQVVDLTTYVTNNVLESSNWGDVTIKSYTPSHTGWYGILLRVGQGGGGIGPSSEPFKTTMKAGMLWNTNGLSTCTAANCNQWQRFMNDEVNGIILYTDIPDDPRYENGGVISISGTSLTLTTDMTFGKGKLTLVATDTAGNEKTVALGNTFYEKGNHIVANMTGLTSGHSYSVGLRAVSEYGNVSYVSFGSAYFGNVTVTKGVDARTDTMASGTFVVSRPNDAESTHFPLEVQYTVSGAAAGVNYEELPLTVTIPAGAASVEVEVRPIWSGLDDKQLNLALKSKLNYFVGSPGTSSILIKGAPYDPFVRFVSTTGNDSNDGCTEATAFLTIDRALTAVSTLDHATIKVLPGTYVPTNRKDSFGRYYSHYEITRPITILGMGQKPEDVHIKSTCTDAGTSKSRVFFLNNAGAKLKNLLITGGRSGAGNEYPNFGSLGGGGVYLESLGGTVEDCVISNCYLSGWNTGGGGIHMWNGRIVRTKFVNNYSGNDRDYDFAGAALCARNGYIENCLMMNNGKGADNNGYGPVHILGNTVLLNCTIAGNHGKESAAVVVQGTSARVINCAIFNNDVQSDGSGHAGVYYLKNSATGAQFINCAADRDIVGGTDCIMTDDGGFVNQVERDYHLAVSSVCRDSANEDYYLQPYATSATDLDGIPRMTGPQRGKQLDIGCYEFDVTALSVDFYADVTTCLMDYDGGLVPYPARFHAVKNGGEGAATYSWDFNDDGVIDLVTDKPDVTYGYPEIGVYTVRLTVTDQTGSASAFKTDYITTGPKYVYVDASSTTPEAPYLSPEKAATNVREVYDHTLNGTTVVVAPGVYGFSKHRRTTEKSSARLDLLKGVKVICQGGSPADTVFTNDTQALTANGNSSFFRLMNEGAVVANATFVDCYDNRSLGGGAGITIESGGGTVSNCVFSHCGTYYPGARAGGANLAGGLLTHCVFDDCFLTNRANTNGRQAQGVHISGKSSVENCLFKNMHGDASIVSVESINSYVRNCTIVDCSVLFWTGNEVGLVTGAPRCRFMCAAIELNSHNGNVINTTIANVSRRAFDYYYDAWQDETGTHWRTNAIPATNAANWSIAYAYSPTYYQDVNKRFQNCATDDPVPINDTCFPVTTADFVDFNGGDFTPAVNGALYDSAIALSGWNKLVDLAGNKRVIGMKMDVGCYEQQDAGEVQVDNYVDCLYTGPSTGKKESPWKTIREACEHATAEFSKIIVRGGPNRSYVFSSYADTATVSADELEIIGCDADWNPARGYDNPDAMATIVVAADYADASYTLAGKKTTWTAPIVINGADCIISGLRSEFGKSSFREQSKGGTGLIYTTADGLTIEDCWFKMKDEAGDYDSACTMGVICSGKGNRRFTLRDSYFRLGKYRASLNVFYYFGAGTRVEGCLFENLDTLYSGDHKGSDVQLADYHIISNIFLNCSNGSGGYKSQLLGSVSQYCPYSGEIAYNRAIHNDGVPGHYVFMQHGMNYGGSWVQNTAIHHNTIVGYDIVFESPLYVTDNGKKNGTMWAPAIFDNLVVSSKTNLWEEALDHWIEGREYNSSFKEGSMFMNNALQVNGMAGGSAMKFDWYDLSLLSGLTDTTITLDETPNFVNIDNPHSENYYRLKVPQAPWVINAYTGDDPAYQEFPRYIGAVAPQPGGFAVRIR